LHKKAHLTSVNADGRIRRLSPLLGSRSRHCRCGQVSVRHGLFYFPTNKQLLCSNRLQSSVCAIQVQSSVCIHTPAWMKYSIDSIAGGRSQALVYDRNSGIWDWTLAFISCKSGPNNTTRSTTLQQCSREHMLIRPRREVFWSDDY
jgi:hypothetical protein